jgi:hypothetical protein
MVHHGRDLSNIKDQFLYIAFKLVVSVAVLVFKYVLFDKLLYLRGYVNFGNETHLTNCVTLVCGLRYEEVTVGRTE